MREVRRTHSEWKRQALYSYRSVVCGSSWSLAWHIHCDLSVKVYWTVVDVAFSGFTSWTCSQGFDDALKVCAAWKTWGYCVSPGYDTFCCDLLDGWISGAGHCVSLLHIRVKCVGTCASDVHEVSFVCAHVCPGRLSVQCM